MPYVIEIRSCSLCRRAYAAQRPSSKGHGKGKCPETDADAIATLNMTTRGRAVRVKFFDGFATFPEGLAFNETRGIGQRDDGLLMEMDFSFPYHDGILGRPAYVPGPANEYEEPAPKTDPELRDALRRALRSLDKEKKRTGALVDAVYQAVSDNIKSIEIPPVPPPQPAPAVHGEEVAVAVLSDWQLGKVTSSYNSEICEQRIKKFAEKVIRLTRIQRADHPVTGLHLWCLGDLLEGELIFPGQAHLIDSSLTDQIFTGARMTADFVRTMLTFFEWVHVSFVPGNHGQMGGRNHRDYHPNSNADRMLGLAAQQFLRDEPRVTWDIASGVEDNWYVIDDIGGYRTMLFHGDQISGGLTTENHLKKLVLGWKGGAIPGGFDDAFLGHFHVIKKFTFNSTTVRVSGSPESDNGYARRGLASVSSPAQHLQFVKPGFGVTAEYTVWLD